ncbi:MAG: galactokinase [candidate division FCPU426 bacterium]
MNPSHEKIRAKFVQIHGDHGNRIQLTRAPGRVNLMGEHTDYNEGWVLPTNMGGMEVVVASSRRSDNLISMYSMDYEEKLSATVGSLKNMQGDGWANYVKGVFWALENAGYKLDGMNLLISGNIPQGSGLSSSSALEAAVACAILASAGGAVDPVKVAKALQAAENQFIGVASGIMDPMSVMAAPSGNALFLDCRSLEADGIPVHFEDAHLLVIDSGVSRSLKTGGYNKRREECAEALKLLKTKNPAYTALRDVRVLAFERHKGVLPNLLRMRAEHVVYENDRVLKAKDALLAGDAEQFGALMKKSHRSQAVLFETSCEEIESLYSIATAQESCLGARLTGGGFGGCLVALVKSDGLESFSDNLKRAYRQKAGGKAIIYPVVATEPAGEIPEE